MKTTIRYCADIKQWAIDRSRQDSCVHATEFCWNACFNNKFENMWNLEPKDIRNDEYWAWLHDNPTALCTAYLDKTARAHHPDKQVRDRFRFMTRGEAFKDYDDIVLIRKIALDFLNRSPRTILWIPTRAWRDEFLRHQIEGQVMSLSNCRVSASTDPEDSNAPEGWSTMFFGDNEGTFEKFRCPKTHHNIKVCDKCTVGCFNENESHVHLKSH